ncbi:MAG TPA: hypothetical protein VH092_20035 [Urbifossiella sp.]|jgi:hypothetical protein|nr:hypothetical protein [Urbifossiella sp.]
MTGMHRVSACLAAALLGCGLVCGLAGGQDDPGGKGKKDKGGPEEKAVRKTADKAAKGPETERDKWVKELNKAYPGRVSPGMSAADFHQWFDELAAGRGEWRREDAPVKQLAELYDRAADRLSAGPVPAIRRDEFVRYALTFLEPTTSPPWKAVDPSAEAGKVFEKLDRDGSGFLEPDEWTDSLRTAARRADRDRDGRISPAEYRAYFEGWVADAIEYGPDRPPARPTRPRPRPSVPAGGRPASPNGSRLWTRTRTARSGSTSGGGPGCRGTSSGRWTSTATGSSRPPSTSGMSVSSAPRG